MSSWSISQNKENVFFEAYVQDDEVINGECTVLTVSVFVSENNQIEMRFHNLAQHVIALNKEITSKFSFFGNSKIYSIKGQQITINDEIFIEYKILEFGVCLDRDVIIPSLNLPMLQVRDSSILTLESDELAIKSMTSEKASKSKLVGDFKLELINSKIANLTGDTSIFEYKIDGFGDLFHFIVDDIEVENSRAITTTKSFYDSVYSSNHYYNEKVLTTKIIHKKSGLFRLEDIINISSFSPRENRMDTLKISRSFKIEGADIEIGNDLESGLAVVIDNSISMELEDYVPHRFSAAKKFANSLLSESSSSYYLVSGKVTKIRKSHITDSMLNYNRSTGTSLGNGLWYAINDLRKQNGKKVIVLLSDGDATCGNVNTSNMALLAKENGIQIFTIGVGSFGLVPYGQDFFGRPRMIDNVFDDQALREIAKLNGGKYYHLPKNGESEIDLIREEIFKELN